MDPLVFSYDPEPIFSHSKASNVARFNAEEDRRQELHKNDPLSTKLLHISVVVIIVVIAFLIFFKFCWDSEKFSRRNPELAKEQMARRQSFSKINTLYHSTTADRDRDMQTMSTFLPELKSGRRGSGSASKLQACSKPACFCLLPNSSGAKTGKQKGWNRNKENEPYGPDNV